MQTGLRKKGIVIFFSGLLLMAGIELGLVWLIEPGLRGNAWLALPLMGGGMRLIIWSVRTLYVAGLGIPARTVTAATQ